MSVPQDLVRDLPPGPLDVYRKQATFDWRSMKVLMAGGEEQLRFKQHIMDTLERDPLFHNELSTPTMEQLRELNEKRWRAVMNYNFVTAEDNVARFWKRNVFINTFELYDQGLSARHLLSSGVFYSSIISMGTEKHMKYLQETDNGELVGCFALTELSHGSNTKAIQTTATYDPVTKTFVFHSPNIHAAKCWVGNLAQCATHSVVFARLQTTEHGKLVDHGLHAFVVRIRDQRTHRPLPGIFIGDMGEKPGAWNGVGNGWMMFNHFHAPNDALLDRGGSVSEEGRYITSHKSVRSRQAANLGALSAGRVGIVGKGVIGTQAASVIAIRYSAIRKQFGPDDRDELAVLEYPLQQYRLFPYLAASYSLSFFFRRFNDHFTHYLMRMIGGDKSPDMADMGREIHGLSSCTKPISTWLGVNGLSEARMACGGHGYLKVSRLSDLRSDMDPSQTFEGDNNMLLQQTSNYLLTLLDDKRKAGTRIASPMGSVNFLNVVIDAKNNNNNAKRAGFDGTSHISDVIAAYEWLVADLLLKCDADIARLTKSGKDGFTARNETMVYRCHSLAIAYGELTIVRWCSESIANDDVAHELKPILTKLCSMFACWALEKHLSSLYIGGYCSGEKYGDTLRRSILRLCKELKPEAVALCDSVAPSDFVLNSALGHSDGQVYDRLFNTMLQSGGSMDRPPWWRDLVSFLQQNAEKHASKL